MLNVSCSFFPFTEQCLAVAVWGKITSARINTQTRFILKCIVTPLPAVVAIITQQALNSGTIRRKPSYHADQSTQKTMVARSRPSLRRSSRCGDQAPIAALVTDSQVSSAITLSHRAKRNRIPSISDAENLRKRRKIEILEHQPKYKFPLRSRPNNEPLRTLHHQNDTKPVSSGQKDETPTPDTPKQKEDGRQRQQYPSHFTEKRTLRSQDGGSRSKSELSLYFTNYEQMLSLEAAKPGEQIMVNNIPRLTVADLLTAKTHITLIDDLPIQSENTLSPPHSIYTSKPLDLDPFGAQKPLHNARRVDLNPVTLGHSPRRLIKNTLPDDVFHKAHRKAERHEKQLRNIEKERAQHEKVQLDRLLDELKGPDWLKVMGISGVTESEKKLYEPKRVFFIREVAGLIEKFRRWKEEEKRRKIEREQALLAEEEEAEEEVEDQDVEDEINGSAQQPSSAPAPISPLLPAPQDTNDVDAAAARQLHQEAISASSPSGTTSRRKKTPPPTSTTASSHPSHLPPPRHLKKELGSFFAKRHMRDAAIAGHRRGRNKLAFGEPVPDPEDNEFELPGSILTRDMIRARARLRRRLRRGSLE